MRPTLEGPNLSLRSSSSGVAESFNKWWTKKGYIPTMISCLTARINCIPNYNNPVKFQLWSIYRERATTVVQERIVKNVNKNSFVIVMFHRNHVFKRRDAL